jgi:hypothetical protein
MLVKMIGETADWILFIDPTKRFAWVWTSVSASGNSLAAIGYRRSVWQGSGMYFF